MLSRKMIVGIVMLVLTVAYFASNEHSGYERTYAAETNDMPRVLAGHDFTKIASDAKYAPGELIVRFSPLSNGEQRTTSEREQILQNLGGGSLKRNYSIVPGLSLVQLPAGMSVQEALVRFNKTSGILYAEANYEVEALSTFPNDPRFSELWGMHNTGQDGGTVDADIDAPEAWDIGTGSSEVIVAVIDTGVDYTHPDLAGNMWTNESERNGTPGVDDDDNGYVDDIYGYDFCNNDGNPMDDHYHGTHCAGTIGGIGNNSEGVAGVCWDVRIMALKFLNSGGSGWTSDAIECVNYSRIMGANLSSNSWGGGGYSQGLKDAIDAAGSAGMLFVAAAGNDNTDNDIIPNYPSNYDCDNIIAVMATDRYDNRSIFHSGYGSNYGLISVDLGAPGSNILSTFPTYETSAMEEWGFSTYYETISGTSMATPHVAGACALMWSEDPTLTFQELKDRLLDSVDPKTELYNECVSGGRLNLAKALGSLGYPCNSTNINKGKCYWSIQAAITHADDGDEIVVYPGTYNEHIDYRNKNITVRGTDPDDWDVVSATVINGSGAARAVNMDARGTLSGFTITGGIYGVYCDSASATVKRCIIRDNSSDGIYCNGRAPVILNNKVFDNGDFGIRSYASIPIIKNNWVYRNGNTGIKFEGQAGSAGTVRNNTVVYNTVKGVWSHGSATDPVVSNCILWGNDNDIAGCEATYSCIQDEDPGEGNIHSVPCFVDANVNDFHIGANSPCIDAGDSGQSYAGETDIDGEPRVMGEADIGADEFDYLVSHWKFDEGSGTTLTDSGFGDNDGTLYGNPNWVAGMIGNYAIDFDGNGDYAGVGSPTNLDDLPLDDFTVSAWIFDEYTAGNTWGTILGCYAYNNGWSIRTFSNAGGDRSLYFQAPHSGGSYGSWATSWSTDGTILQNTWHHVTAVWNVSSKTATLYIDSEVPSYQGIVPGVGLYNSDASRNKEIGRIPHVGGIQYFNGKIDDIRIYKRALSAGGIQELYQEGMENKKARDPNPANGETRVATNVIISWSAWAYATYHDVYFGTSADAVENATTSSAEYKGRQQDTTWDPPGDLSPDTTYYWRIDEVGSSEYVWKGDVWRFTTRYAPVPDFIGWWEFDEWSGWVAYDTTGENDGTLYGGTEWVGGMIGGALDFDGSGDYVGIGSPDSLDDLPLANYFTVCAWIYDEYTTGNTWGTILGCYAYDNGWSLRTFSNAGGERSLYFQAPHSGDSYGSWATTQSAYGTIGTGWHHVAAVWSAYHKTADLYIDGVPSIQTRTWAYGPYNSDASNNKEIGRIPHVGGIQYFNGKIDDVRIYRRALSGTEILNIFNGAN